MTKKNNKKNKKNGSKKTVQRARSRRDPPGPRLGLSKCAAEYYDVLTNPFSGRVACVPSEFNFPSMKHFARAIGTFSTSSTSGFGFISLKPFHSPWAWSTVSQQPVAYSDGSYVGNTFANAGTGVNLTNMNTPYLEASNAQSIEARLVGAGIRVRNITALLNRGGQLGGVEMLNHTDMNGQTFATILLQDTAEVLPHAGGEWNAVTFHPEDPQEINWNSSGTVQTNPSVYLNAFLGFAVSTTAANPQTFEFEVCAVYEAKGTNVHGLRASESDPIGFAQVQNALSDTAHRKPHTDNGWSDSFLGYAAKGIGVVAGMGVQAYRGYQAVRPSRSITYSIPRIEEMP
jgi:hypothetical protein